MDPGVAVVIVGILSLAGSIGSALVLYNRNTAVLEEKHNNLREDFGTVKRGIDDLEDKVDDHIKNTRQCFEGLGSRVQSLERDVSFIKKKGTTA